MIASEISDISHPPYGAGSAEWVGTWRRVWELERPEVKEMADHHHYDFGGVGRDGGRPYHESRHAKARAVDYRVSASLVGREIGSGRGRSRGL